MKKYNSSLNGIFPVAWSFSCHLPKRSFCLVSALHKSLKRKLSLEKERKLLIFLWFSTLLTFLTLFSYKIWPVVCLRFHSKVTLCCSFWRSVVGHNLATLFLLVSLVIHTPQSLVLYVCMLISWLWIRNNL